MSTDIVEAVIRVHGGVKYYRGAPRAARAYVEQDRSRADDYYLAEGNGVATRLLATPGGARSMGCMTGEVYEQWVAGFNLETMTPKGHIPTEHNALRFVEVVVNGPKTWSLAAALHPEVSDALDRAQDKAAPRSSAGSRRTNGIGHAAVATDPEFRAVPAAHGLTRDPETSEIREPAPSWPTPTTYGSSTNAAASPKHRWPCSTRARWTRHHHSRQ